jgi:hypothetical protein
MWSGLFSYITLTIYLCNAEVLCSLWGTDWILKYYSYEFNAEMVPKFQVATACFSCSPPNFKLIKITPYYGCRLFNCFPNYRYNKKFKIPLSEATPYYHNVLTFTLFLPEGRACVAWEPSKNNVLSPPPPRKMKCHSLHPLISSLNLFFIYPSHLSLSLSLSVSRV